MSISVRVFHVSLQTSGELESQSLQSDYRWRFGAPVELKSCRARISVCARRLRLQTIVVYESLFSHRSLCLLSEQALTAAAKKNKEEAQRLFL
jgi:hypothetical protein